MSDYPVFEKWKTLTAGLPSPDIIIEAGFYSLIAAALERRVWLNEMDFMPLFPNLFTALVTKAGVGKGNVSDIIQNLLAFHPAVPLGADGIPLDDAIEHLKEKPVKELLFPMADDCITFEQLVSKLESVTRAVRVAPPYPRGVKKIYRHNSICFVLDELNSVFRDDATNTTTFLCTTYNCKKYDKDTKHHGGDFIEKTCVNIIGGVTVKKFQELVKKDIFTTGILARMIVVYAEEDETRRTYFMPEMSEARSEALEFFKSHVLRLSKCFGKILIEPGLKEELNEEYKDKDKMETNKHPMLEEYYGRLQQHESKHAILGALSEDPDCRLLTREHFNRARGYLKKLEVNMHKPFMGGGSNKLSKASNTLLERLNCEGFMTEPEIHEMFTDDLRAAEIKELIDTLVSTRKLKTTVSLKTKQTIYARNTTRPEEESVDTD